MSTAMGGGGKQSKSEAQMEACPPLWKPKRSLLAGAASSQS